MAHGKRLPLHAQLILDLAMCLVVGLLYKADVISLKFHMVAGVLLALLIVVHIVAHRKVIAALATRARVSGGHAAGSLAISGLLLAALAAVVVSGILMSKPVVRGTSDPADALHIVHYAASAASIVLIGVHVGWYWDRAHRCVGKRVRLDQTLARVCLAVVLGVGLYSIATTDFATWIVNPAGVVPASATQGSGSVLAALVTGAQFISIVAVFATATHLVKRRVRA